MAAMAFVQPKLFGKAEVTKEEDTVAISQEIPMEAFEEFKAFEARQAKAFPPRRSPPPEAIEEETIQMEKVPVDARMFEDLVFDEQVPFWVVSRC